MVRPADIKVPMGGNRVTREEIYHEIKKDRDTLRSRISRKVCQDIERAARGGFFPDIKNIVDSICDEIANMMEHYDTLDSRFWSIILQKREPDARCKRFMYYADKLNGEEVQVSRAVQSDVGQEDVQHPEEED